MSEKMVLGTKEFMVPHFGQFYPEGGVYAAEIRWRRKICRNTPDLSVPGAFSLGDMFKFHSLPTV